VKPKLKGCVYRPSTGRGTKARYYWAKYYGPGAPKPHALLLPDGERITDKAVALARLRDVLRRHERKSAGLIDPEVEAAGKPLWRVLLATLRDLKRRRRSGRYIKDVRKFAVRVFRDGNMHRLGDLNPARLTAALAKLDDGTRAERTLQAYRAAAVVVGAYVCAPHVRMLPANPVRACPMPEGGRVRERRALTEAEARDLLRVAPMPRRLFYHVALLTGYRVAEVAALRWADVDLGERPAVQLPMQATKGGKLSRAKRRERWDVEIPLHPELADALREYKPAGASAGDRVFQATPQRRTLLVDLEAAGIARVDGRGRSIDRHALRTTFRSWLLDCGVNPRLHDVLMRTAPRGVADRHYADYRLTDLWAEIAKLPSVAPNPEAKPEAARLAAAG